MRMAIILLAVFVLMTFFPSAGHAVTCHKSGDTVSITGTVQIHTLPPDAHAGVADSGTYPALRFDRPVCVTDSGSKDVTDRTIASIIFMGPKLKLTDGQHVRLQGELVPRQMPDQPPEELVFFVKNLPADAPEKGEITISGQSDDVAKQCAKATTDMAAKLGSTILRIVVTGSPRWGTILRADTSVTLPGGTEPILSRTVCMKGFYLVRPLEMFDPSKSIPRLP
jgi:hypothetical protein